VWALLQYGIQAVLAPSFSDIFAGNSAQNGLVTGRIPGEIVQELAAAAETVPAPVFEVDLRSQTVRWSSSSVRFDIKPAEREILLTGSDDIGLILQHLDEIETHEGRRPRWAPDTTFAQRDNLRPPVS
jgi:3-isopropylmalate/(R)-2-methylmalate dehydratase small subunit